MVLDEAAQKDGSKRAVYADSAYRSQERESQLAIAGIASEICEKGVRDRPLTERKGSINHSVRVDADLQIGARSVLAWN